MYCYHCGKEIDEHKVEAKESSLEKHVHEIDENTKIEYVCPRCGWLIHEGMTEQDKKTLSAAAHAEIQRGKNSFASGMVFNVLGAIFLVLAFVFLRLSQKPAEAFKLVVTSPEFMVSMAFFVVTIGAFGYGIVMTVLGIIKQRKYMSLLNDIQHDTFVQ